MGRRLSPTPELSERHLGPILKKSNRLLLRRIGRLIAEETEKLLKRQIGSPPGITLLKPEITLFTAHYVAAVIETAGELAEELAQAVGQRKGLAGEQQRWVKSQSYKFFYRRTSAKVSKAVFNEAFSSYFNVANEEQSESEFVRQVARAKARSLPLNSVGEAIEHAVALYPARGRSADEPHKNSPSPTPGEKVANPIRYPVMTPSEVSELFSGKSRSTIYRWLDEKGKLKRAAMSEKPGKRRTCFILTSSVKELLRESSE